ncbi:chemotaxis protein [Helicobacter monodelphidis]|uniref:CheR family methyltransferase n=1 Tax=Helicobacter sp. 15-1451 TaxID=2004995 RepID=UPI000DCD12DA|nr:protein-glutamate O-methyltransferase CheR [Helicobacter sp. 15-1451]RAX58179.1 chemotaxis protein [Helicobacter sp. 15-1451]
MNQQVDITREFLDQIRTELYEKTGIFLDKSKDTLITNRIKRLIKDLGILNNKDFFEKISRHEQDFINAFTTNKTDFFREGFHFLDMIDRVMPRVCAENRPFKVYCSASSTGEEPYSIAATLLHAKNIYGTPNLPISILATDVDTDVLEIAKKGVYQVNTRLSPLPTWLNMSDYFNIRNVGTAEVSIEAVAALKSMITFKVFNLFTKKYPFQPEEFDIIFCRNVLIYFKVEDQAKILENLFKCLKMYGTLYLGHSENVLSLSHRVERLGQNCFVKIAH